MGDGDDRLEVPLLVQQFSFRHPAKRVGCVPRIERSAASSEPVHRAPSRRLVDHAQHPDIVLAAEPPRRYASLGVGRAFQLALSAVVWQRVEWLVTDKLAHVLDAAPMGHGLPCCV